MVREIMVDGHWDLNNLSLELPVDITSAILATPLRRYLESEDQRNWISNLSGNFDPKNSYLLVVGEEGAPDFKGKWIWKLKILPKIKCFYGSVCTKVTL